MPKMISIKAVKSSLSLWIMQRINVLRPLVETKAEATTYEKLPCRAKQILPLNSLVLFLQRTLVPVQLNA